MEQENVPFSDSLKNSCILKPGIDHKKQVIEIVSTSRNMENDSERLYSINRLRWTNLVTFVRNIVKHWSTEAELKNEFKQYLPTLKETHQGERRNALRELNLEFADRFTRWCKQLHNLGFVDQRPLNLKDE